jgi:hypothetical protein
MSCDESETGPQDYITDTVSTYTEWGNVTNTSCGINGKGTFTVTAASINATLCNGAPQRAVLTEKGITWDPDTCDSSADVEY